MTPADIERLYRELARAVAIGDILAELYLRQRIVQTTARRS